MSKTPLPIGPNIRRIRELRGLTQQALAEKIGYTNDTSGAAISRLESGQHAPVITTLSKIAEALEVPMEMLLATWKE